MSFFRDLRIAFHSLLRTRGFAVIVILTLALGIGANAAIFTLVRGVLLKPLVNRDEDRLVYIRQSALGIGDENTAFSVPEIHDLRASVKTLSSFGEFSTAGFTMIGLGEPCEVKAGVVDGSYFDVMGLHPVLGRLIEPQDDGPNAAGVVVLTYRFWATTLKKDPSVLGRTLRLGSVGERSATIIGVLEPSVPYPEDTEIIANVVTSPHHLSATMVTGRVHRMTELFGRLAPGATLDDARAELRSVYSTIKKDHPEAYSSEADFRINAKLFHDGSRTGSLRFALLRSRTRFDCRFQPALGGSGAGRSCRGDFGICPPPAIRRRGQRNSTYPAAASGSQAAPAAASGFSRSRKLPRRSCSWPEPAR